MRGYMTPARSIFVAFALALTAGTVLLMLPVSSRHGGASWSDSLFTATSALCVTGLTVVDTPTHWTPFGHVVILGLIQLGGLGVMTFASVVGIAVMHKMSLRGRLTAATEVKSIGLDGVRHLTWSIFRITVVVETVIAIMLFLRFYLGYGEPVGRALWLGVFHSVSSFNNAGFALFSDSMIGFVSDPLICLPICAGIIIGGIGFPVIMQLRRYGRDAKMWSMGTRLVLLGTAALLVIGTVYLTILEWNNPSTLGALDYPSRLLAGFFQSVQTRTAGFNSIDISKMDAASWLGMDILMFIGAGPAGTAGGVKVTTIGVLMAIALTEIRGDNAVNIFGKRLSRSVHRQAITVLLFASLLVVGATILLMDITDFKLDVILFEVISAFGTVGLSTGITPHLPVAAQLILVPLMFIGRVGPITFASALALRHRRRMYELPKERPIIG